MHPITISESQYGLPFLIVISNYCYCGKLVSNNHYLILERKTRVWYVLRVDVIDKLDGDTAETNNTYIKHIVGSESANHSCRWLVEMSYYSTTTSFFLFAFTLLIYSYFIVKWDGTPITLFEEKQFVNWLCYLFEQVCGYTNVYHSEESAQTHHILVIVLCLWLLLLLECYKYITMAI